MENKVYEHDNSESFLYFLIVYRALTIIEVKIDFLQPATFLSPDDVEHGVPLEKLHEANKVEWRIANVYKSYEYVQNRSQWRVKSALSVRHTG